MKMITIHLIGAKVKMAMKKRKSLISLIHLILLSQKTVLTLLCGKPRSLRGLLTKRVARCQSVIFVELSSQNGTAPSLGTLPLVGRMLLVARGFLHGRSLP
jgi:hypothetical protein